MNEIAQLREWYAFNSEVRKKYLKTLSALPRRALLKDRKASFPSLLDIYVHTLDAYNFADHRNRPGGAQRNRARL